MLFAGLSLIWGFSFLLIKIGTQGFAPLQISFGRMLFGTLVLGAAVVVKRARLPRRARTWAHLAVAAFFLNALPFTLFAYAELHISSTLAGICNATSPLWGMVIGLVALREDRPTRRSAAGLGIGFAGVLTVLGAWQGFAGQDLTGTALALIASASYAVGWAYVRRFLKGTNDSQLSMVTGQLLLGTAQLALVMPLVSGIPDSLPLGPLAAVFVLGTLSTGLGVLMQHRLVAEVGPTAGQTITYFVPIIATIAGVVILGEALTWTTPVGAAIILAGAALMQFKPAKKKAGSGV